MERSKPSRNEAYHSIRDVSDALLADTGEDVLLGICRLGEYGLDIDDWRSINRFDRPHFNSHPGDFSNRHPV